MKWLPITVLLSLPIWGIVYGLVVMRFNYVVLCMCVLAAVVYYVARDPRG